MVAFASVPRSSDELGAAPDADTLIQTYAPAAQTLAARYRNRGIDSDDLEQVAMLGLIKAAQRFDPAAGHDFMSYAVPTIRGELRRHFRDVGWAVRPPRRIQELQARIGAAEESLTASLGRSPRPTEIAAYLDMAPAQVMEALAVDGCFAPTSLDVPSENGRSHLRDSLGHDDVELERSEARMLLAPVLRELKDRDRRIVHLRFYEERSQQEIAEAIGLTQAQVSRILTRILAELGSRIGAVSGRTAA